MAILGNAKSTTMFRNESSRLLVERVAKSMQEPYNIDLDITGLEIDYSVKTLILKNYEAQQPFALADETEQYLVYFFPTHGCAIWCDAGEVTLNTFQGPEQFEKAVKAGLIAHRKFMSVRQIGAREQYKEICEQLKRIGE